MKKWRGIAARYAKQTVSYSGSTNLLYGHAVRYTLSALSRTFSHKNFNDKISYHLSAYQKKEFFYVQAETIVNASKKV